jgi:Ca2+-binding RTX toxin-like protein
MSTFSFRIHERFLSESITMKNDMPRLSRRLLSSLIALALVLVQFPTIALAHSPSKAVSRTQFRSLERGAVLPPVVFSNPGSITINDRAGTATPNGISSPYPSTIAVSGLTGAVTNVAVTLTGYSAARPRDTEFALVGPGGQALVLMSDAGDLTSTAPGIDLTFSDAAAALVPTGSGSTIPSGTYRPTDVLVAAPAGNDNFPAPGPSSVNSPAPAGTATLGSVFNGTDANGTWSLYAIDDSLGGGASTVSGGWSLEITVDENIALTSTTVVSSMNPASTTQNVTFTATVTSGGSPVTGGSVSFTDNGNAIAGCTGVALNGSGNAACTTTFAEGSHNIVATFSGATSFGMSSGNVAQVINSQTIVTGAQFCNNGGVSIPDSPGSTSPYPSNISVSGLFGTVSNVTVQINGLTAPRTNNLDLLLVGPAGQGFEMMSDVGDSTTAATGVNLTLDDAASGLLPVGLPLSSGTFRPTDSNVIGAPDVYPAPAPGSFDRPAPAASSTFASVYGGSDPNGNWRLYAVDDAIGGGTSTITAWCVNFTVTPVATSTTLVSSLNPSNTGSSVTFTATVSSSGGIPSGSVEFLDGVTSLGTALLNGSGIAALSTSSLTGGSHNITATYQGATIGAGGGGFAGSTSNTVVQIVRTAPTANPDNYSTNEDTPLNIAAPGVLGNDTDPDPGTTLTAALVTGPTNAQSFILNADGSFSYTPAPNFNGSDSFTYKARDNANLESSAAIVTITVNAVDDGPEVVVSPGASCGSSYISGTINLMVSDLDTPAGNLTLNASSSNTALVPNANIVFAGSGANRTMTVTTVPQATVQVSTITITASDGQGGSNQITVTVTVGTNLSETINGTSGTDMVFARNGEDTVSVGGGIDLVCGGLGNDTINGGSGDDTLNGENGNDILNGDDGNDFLFGELGADQLLGGNDNDTLTGGTGADFFGGGAGNDTATDFTPSQGDTSDGSLAMRLREFAELLDELFSANS